jgi:hypothetical protein
MNGRWKLAVAAVVGAAIAIPATVIARGDLNSGGNADKFATASVSNASTNSKNYQPVGLVLPESAAPMMVTVSAQMTQGKARFRVVRSNGQALPSSVQFGSKAANSFTFGDITSCPVLHIEWKKVGKEEAQAAEVAFSSVYELAGCF